MTRIGFIGLGKLGLPVAAAMALRGADVMGYDLDPARMSYAPQPFREAGPDGTGNFNEVLGNLGDDVGAARFQGRLRFGALKEVVAHAEIIFLAVQTPHDARFGGEAPLRDEPVDFDYSYLVDAVKQVVAAKADVRTVPLAVISTVLPGTMAKLVKPLLPTHLPLVYNPHFIAMGTVMQDFLNPEFVLLGVDDEWAAAKVEQFYRIIFPLWAQNAQIVKRMSVASAELTKVAYNTYISTKIAVANTLMEICHKTPGANVDEVSRALQAADKRICAPAYMTGGMGDGGGCHPRDNIALTWLAKRLELSYDPFWAAMKAREDQNAWLARIAFQSYLKAKAARIVVAGYAFKPGTNITTGSPAILLANQLREAFGLTITLWDPHVNPRADYFPYASKEREVVFLGCRHPEFEGWDGAGLAEGSVVIDPHRITGAPAAGVKIIRVGEGR